MPLKLCSALLALMLLSACQSVQTISLRLPAEVQATLLTCPASFTAADQNGDLQLAACDYQLTVRQLDKPKVAGLYSGVQIGSGQSSSIQIEQGRDEKRWQFQLVLRQPGGLLSNWDCEQRQERSYATLNRQGAEQFLRAELICTSQQGGVQERFRFDYQQPEQLNWQYAGQSHTWQLRGQRDVLLDAGQASRLPVDMGWCLYTEEGSLQGCMDWLQAGGTLWPRAQHELQQQRRFAAFALLMRTLQREDHLLHGWKDMPCIAALGSC